MSLKDFYKFIPLIIFYNISSEDSTTDDKFKNYKIANYVTTTTIATCQCLILSRRHVTIKTFPRQ